MLLTFLFDRKTPRKKSRGWLAYWGI